MMDEELHLQPGHLGHPPECRRDHRRHPHRSHDPAASVLVLARTPALILAIALSALVLFGVGVYSAVTLVGDWRRSGLKMMLIGLGAASVGFLIGPLLHAAGG